MENIDIWFYISLPNSFCRFTYKSQLCNGISGISILLFIWCCQTASNMNAQAPKIP